MSKTTTQGPVADLVLERPKIARPRDAEPARRDPSPQIGLPHDTVEALYDHANALREAGQLDEAIAAYSRAHDLEPGSAEILNNLGDAFRARGRIGEAILACRSAIQLRPDFAEAHNNLGNALRDQGKFNEAIAAYNRALQLRPEVHSIHNNLGIVLSLLGRLDEALTSYMTAIRLRPDYAKAHNNLGTVLRDKGRFDEAARACRRAIELKPDFAQAYHNLGCSLTAMGHLGNAIAAFNRALELQPKLSGVHQHLADAYRQTGQLANAITAFRRAIQLKPTDARLHCSLGHALKDSGRVDEAIGAYINSIQLRPDFVEPYFNLGNAFRDKNQYEQAVDVYREALKLRPDLATVHNHLGVVLNLSGKVNEAIDSFAAAVKLKPNYAKAYNNLGAALRDAGRFEEAVAACHTATVLKPDYAMGHYNLGKALRDVGRFDDAVSAYLAAVRLQPNLAEAHNNLGNVYKERGQLDEAIAAYAKAVALRPDMAQARANLESARQERARFASDASAQEHEVMRPADAADSAPAASWQPSKRTAGGAPRIEDILPIHEPDLAEPPVATDDVIFAEIVAPEEASLNQIASPEAESNLTGSLVQSLQASCDDLGLPSPILFEPLEILVANAPPIAAMPSTAHVVEDPRNVLMASASDVAAPAANGGAAGNEDDDFFFSDEADERPLPPVAMPLSGTAHQAQDATPNLPATKLELSQTPSDGFIDGNGQPFVETAPPVELVEEIQPGLIKPLVGTPSEAKAEQDSDTPLNAASTSVDPVAVAPMSTTESTPTPQSLPREIPAWVLAAKREAEIAAITSSENFQEVDSSPTSSIISPEPSVSLTAHEQIAAATPHAHNNPAQVVSNPVPLGLESSNEVSLAVERLVPTPVPSAAPFLTATVDTNPSESASFSSSELELGLSAPTGIMPVAARSIASARPFLTAPAEIPSPVTAGVRPAVDGPLTSYGPVVAPIVPEENFWAPQPAVPTADLNEALSTVNTAVIFLPTPAVSLPAADSFQIPEDARENPSESAESSILSTEALLVPRDSAVAPSTSESPSVEDVASLMPKVVDPPRNEAVDVTGHTQASGPLNIAQWSDEERINAVSTTNDFKREASATRDTALITVTAPVDIAVMDEPSAISLVPDSTTEHPADNVDTMTEQGSLLEISAGDSRQSAIAETSQDSAVAVMESDEICPGAPASDQKIVGNDVTPGSFDHAEEHAIAIAGRDAADTKAATEDDAVFVDRSAGDAETFSDVQQEEDAAESISPQEDSESSLWSEAVSSDQVVAEVSRTEKQSDSDGVGLSVSGAQVTSPTETHIPVSENIAGEVASETSWTLVAEEASPVMPAARIEKCPVEGAGEWPELLPDEEESGSEAADLAEAPLASNAITKAPICDAAAPSSSVVEAAQIEEQPMVAPPIEPMASSMPQHETSSQEPAVALTEAIPEVVHSEAPISESAIAEAASQCELAQAHQAKGKLDFTIHCYQRALELNPKCREALAGMERTERDKRRLTDAVAACEAQLSTRPEDADVYCQLAEAQHNNEQYDDAIKSYENAIRIRPDFAYAYCKLGNALRDHGMVSEAKEAYRDALAIRSDLREAQNNLLDLAFRRPQLPAAAMTTEHGEDESE